MFDRMFIALSAIAGAAAAAVVAPRKAGGSLDLQAHRGGRGNTVENVLPSFAWGLINGASTLEMDNGITKDGEVVVWHDEWIDAGKCMDTEPVEDSDPDYPYVGKLIKDLTLAQLKTLDCGSLQQSDFPSQRTYPGTKLSTLGEVFDFVSCVDPEHTVAFNIESKVNNTILGVYSAGVNTFVTKQWAAFKKSGYLDRITYQSFDWRTLVEMQLLHPGALRTSALMSDLNLYLGTPYLPIDLGDFLAESLEEAAVLAVALLGIDVVSPQVTAVDDGFRAFVKLSNTLGKAVLPWTIDDMSVAEDLIALGVQGVITDYTDEVRALADELGVEVVSPLGAGAAPKWSEETVLTCLDEHLALQK